MENRARTTWGLFGVILMMACLFTLWGCPKKAEVSSLPDAQKDSSTAAAAQSETKADAKAGTKPETAAPSAGDAQKLAKEETAANERAAAAKAGTLRPVYFDFDRSFIRDDARPVMKANADWLKAHPKVKVRVEGNCDERGTIEYNQALGQRRAAAAKKYLVDLGIPSARISLISYGKEKQVCAEANEDCWQKNRRGEIVAAD